MWRSRTAGSPSSTGAARCARRHESACAQIVRALDRAERRRAASLRRRDRRPARARMGARRDLCPRPSGARRAGGPGLQLRASARVRRRPHLGDRQHHPEADRRGRAPARESGSSSRWATRRSCSRSSAALAVAAGAVHHALPALALYGGVVGAGVSGIFLWAIGALNAERPGGDHRARPARRVTAGSTRPSSRRSSSQRGLISRVCGRRFDLIHESPPDVPRRRPVRARVRHRHRGRAADDHREPGRRRRPGRWHSSRCRSCSRPACRRWTPPTACS